MPIASAAFTIPTMLLLIGGCSLSPLLRHAPFQIKAVIEGEIKGHKIRCEKTIHLADGKWSVLCNVGNDMDVKYRVRPMNNDQAQVEFIVGKSKDGQQKVIATPTVVVKKDQSTKNVTTTGSSNIVVMAERIR